MNKILSLLLLGAINLNANDAINTLSADQKIKMSGVSYHHGCPVPLDDLRAIHIKYVGFDRRVYNGKIIVNYHIAKEVSSIFNELYQIKYPIKSINPIDTFQGSDWRSIEADNTSAFNCRNATGEKSWSKHAYGLAIDINPIENPYVFRSGKTSHKSSVPYLDRNNHNLTHSDAIITKNSKIYKIFQKYGWKWGGEWNGAKDYQHFYKE